MILPITKAAMSANTTLFAAAVCLFGLLLAGWSSRRRGIDRWSLLPWDYLMVLFGAMLLAALAHLAALWRDGAF